MFAAVRSAAVRYDAVLHRRPLLVKCITAGVVVCSSDVIVQLLSRPTQQYDPRRTVIVGVGYGALWFAPMMHLVTTTWTRVLSSTAPSALLLKASVDMCTSFPLNMTCIISLQAIARNDEVMPLLRQNVLPIYVNAWKFWPLWSMIMYGFVPLHYRVLWLNSGSLGWNTYAIWQVQHSKKSKLTKSEWRKEINR